MSEAQSSNPEFAKPYTPFYKVMAAQVTKSNIFEMSDWVMGVVRIDEKIEEPYIRTTNLKGVLPGQIAIPLNYWVLKFGEGEKADFTMMSNDEFIHNFKEVL